MFMETVSKPERGRASVHARLGLQGFPGEFWFAGTLAQNGYGR
jgi:hypothetical protein